jgi:hypothetical protein
MATKEKSSHLKDRGGKRLEKEERGIGRRLQGTWNLLTGDKTGEIERQHLEERVREAEERLAQERREWERQRQERKHNEWLERELLKKERLEIERKEAEERDQERRRQEDKMRRLKSVSPETLMELRELLRARYQLDVEIWNLRKVRRPDRPIVQAKMAKSDALLEKIRIIVKAWDGTESSWTPHEWKQAQEIQTRILADGKRIWTNNPPWNEE